MPKTLAVGQVDIGDASTDIWRSVLLFIPRAIAFIVDPRGRLAHRQSRPQDRGHGAGTGALRPGRRTRRHQTGPGRTKYDASDILAKLAYYAVLLFTLQFAFGVWGPNAISDLISGVVAWLPRAFVAIVIVVVAAAIANAVRDLVTGALGGLSYGKVLADLTAIFIMALGVIAALNQVGIATTVTTPVLIAVLATVAGILIVGVGGGLVKPMQDRWDGWLHRAAEESRAVQEHRQATAAGRGDSSGRWPTGAGDRRQACRRRAVVDVGRGHVPLRRGGRRDPAVPPAGRLTATGDEGVRGVIAGTP